MKGKRALFFFLLGAVALVNLITLLPNIIIGNLVDHVLYENVQLTWIERLLHITAQTDILQKLLRYILAIVVVTLLYTGLRYVSHFFIY